ncbi:MAG: ATP-dependent Clp protease ATP-binding subunit [Merismopedia sp. SIO2A8]|nr:ATP-dependent Clp protease ATP-binding subunit [Merismopedia sp. SIO2A8]
MFEHFSREAIATIMAAQNEARMLKQRYVGSELILLGLMTQTNTMASSALKQCGLTLRAIQAEVAAMLGQGEDGVPTEIPFTPKTKQLFQQSIQEARQFDQDVVAPEHLLLAIIRDPKNVASHILKTLGADLEQIRKVLLDRMGDAAIVGATRSTDRASKRFSNRDKKRKSQAPKALAEFATNLTELATEGKLDPIIGRDTEITRVVQILGRRRKNNPVLLGEPGVGKTAIAEGLAQRIINQDVPETLLDKQVFSLDVGSLVAGSKLRGEFEERLQQLIAEVQAAGNIILVIDEVHTLVGAGAMGSGTDAANMLKPALARGELQCIGATTLDEYRKYVEKDAALERRFQPVMVEEPSIEDTIAILHGLRGRYEQHHQLVITDEALVSAAELGDRYISDRYLPDKAIDLIDEAGSRVRFRNYQARTEVTEEQQRLNRELQAILQSKHSAADAQDFAAAAKWLDQEAELRHQLQAQPGNPSEVSQPGSSQPGDSQIGELRQVSSEDIAQVVSAWTGVPVNRLSQSESAMLVHLEEQLHERLIGQEEAVATVAKSIRRARVGLSNPNRPMGSFIFCGPTGVGKTELAKALAAAVFGSEDAMVRIDMSEYMERQSTSKLIGSPPGFIGYDEGGQLTEAVRRNPYTLILMDEIEKAHPDVFNLMLQLLDDGQLTDAQGRTVNFKNTMIIMTSNLGAQSIEKGGLSFGFEVENVDSTTARYHRIQSQVTDRLKEFFRPEFLNRLDDVIVFRQLTRDEVGQIADLQLHQVTSRMLEEHGITFEVTPEFKEHLITQGYDPSYGARPLRRAIARLVEDQLAEAVLNGDIQSGESVVLALDDDLQVVVQPQKQGMLVDAIA